MGPLHVSHAIAFACDIAAKATSIARAFSGATGEAPRDTASSAT